jgi:hypothetical protein
MLWNCQPSSPFVCLPSASASCRTTAHCPLTTPTLVVPRSPLPGLIVLIFPPCYRPYARCILLCCCHCVCNFHLLLMSFVTAPSLVCWHVHAATSCRTPLLSGWLLCHGALIVIVLSYSNGAPRPPSPRHPPLSTLHTTHLMALTAIPILIPSNHISSPSSLSRIRLLQLVIV